MSGENNFPHDFERHPAVERSPPRKLINNSKVENKQGEAENLQQMTVAEESTPDIFKLNVDCFHEIFDWLSLQDLMSTGRTCRRLHQVAGDFYRTNYASKRIIAENGDGNMLYRYLNIFAPYIKKISISGNHSKVYNFVGKNCKSIREIRLGNNLLEDSIEYLKEVLQNVEVIEMNECFFRQEFYEYFLKFCSKLKNLSVKRAYKVRDKSVIIGSDNNWLCRHYPTLEHFELTELYELKSDELKTFFNLNPNVRSVSADSISLETNSGLFLSFDPKFDAFAIELSNRNESKFVYDLLAQLHERGFYKRLHVYSRCNLQENLDEILSMPFSNAVESLHFDIPWSNHMIHIDHPLKNLKILAIDNPCKIQNIETLPSKLPNLERIYFREANIQEIRPFICGSTKLKTMKIFRVVHSDRLYCVSEFPKLFEMNKEHKKLVGARKVAIYICEGLILVSKWAKKATNLDLIELRRFDSLEWNDLNSSFRHNHSTHYF